MNDFIILAFIHFFSFAFDMLLLLSFFFVSKFRKTLKHTHKHINIFTLNTCLITLNHTVSGSNKYDVGGAAYEASSYGATRHSRYSSSRTEERISSNGNLNAVTSSTSATSYFAITGEEGVGKPVIKKTCKGVTIERKSIVD